jgi:hypothetical protein
LSTTIDSAVSTPDAWSGESKYLAYLERERRLFAWTLRQYGSFTEVAADDAALACYPSKVSATIAA